MDLQSRDVPNGLAHLLRGGWIHREFIGPMVYTASPDVDGVNPFGQIPASEFFVILWTSDIQNGTGVTAKIRG
jgi:hypothetical protein